MGNGTRRNRNMKFTKKENQTMAAKAAHKPTYADLGSVSHGTMRPEDLLPCFISLLDDLKEKESFSNPDPSRFDILADIEQRMQSKDYWQSDEPSEDLEELFDLLNEYAPPYCYFGSNEGDGSDYGYWVAWDSLEDDSIAPDDWQAARESHPARSAAEVTQWLGSPPLKVADTADIPAGFIGDVMQVSDHGNVTLYACDEGGELTELWSVV